MAIGRGRRLSFDVPTGEVAVWILAGLFYGVLDSSLTFLILQLGGVETMPVARWFLATFGLVGLVLQKVLIFGVFASFAVGITLLARQLSQPGYPYRTVIAAVVLGRGLQIVAMHIEHITALS